MVSSAPKSISEPDPLDWPLEESKGDMPFDFTQRIPRVPLFPSYGPSRANIGIGKLKGQER